VTDSRSQTPKESELKDVGPFGAEADLEAGEQSVQPFRLVKYFSLTGFVVILVFTLLLSILISHQAKTLVLKKSEDYAHVLADNLNHQVFLQFVLPTVQVFGRIRLKDPVQFERLDTVVRNTIHSFKIPKVNIIGVEGVILYSTDQDLVGTESFNQKAFQAALKGQTTSILTSRSGEGLNRFKGTRWLQTYFPFRAEKRTLGTFGQVLGIFEIHQDLSDEYAEISKFQYLTIAISLIFTCLLFVILRKILGRAEGIIEQRSEERRRLEEKLHHSQRLASLGRMIAAVSHEIRNPLGIISSTAQILQGKIKTYEPKNRLADVLVEESRRLNDIVTEFLDFARPQRPKPQRFRLEEILEKNLQFLAPAIEQGRIEIVRDYQGPEYIEGDPDLLYRAFLNVFLNAVQAMPEGGQIKVSTLAPYGENGRNLGQVEVVVADTGLGLEPGAADKLFTPFFTTKNRGSGLGLSIVKNIVDGHKGQVSISPGRIKGTMVSIRLPINQD